MSDRTPKGPTMTPAEIAAWVSMAIDGSLHRRWHDTLTYDLELIRRARRFEREDAQ